VGSGNGDTGRECYYRTCLCRVIRVPTTAVHAARRAAPTSSCRASGGRRRACTTRQGGNRPISVYRPGEMPIQSCGQSVSAPRGEAGVRLNAHTELRVKRQRSARGAIYRNRVSGARTRPTFCSVEPSPLVRMSIHCEGRSRPCGHVRSRVDCLFAMTILAGLPDEAVSGPAAVRRASGAGTVWVRPGRPWSKLSRLAFNSRNEAWRMCRRTFRAIGRFRYIASRAER